MTNITIVSRGKTIRLASENRALMEALIIASPVATRIVGEANGKKYTFQLISGKGFRWVELP